MSFLPIVDRELRVASRRWTTFLIRGGVALLAILFAMPALFIGWLSGGSSGAGQGAFSVLSNYIFVLAVSGGLFITADCLSSEKRQGTLGLLFLTDLRGYDVVLGKFAGLGLHSMYGMLAVFPALALPLLTGGVTGDEFWRVALALLNLLFVSLAAGTVASAASREASRAFWATLILLVLLVLVLPNCLGLFRWMGAPAWLQNLAWINPGHAFSVGKMPASPVTDRDYWSSLAVSHLLAWAFLIAAGLIVPRAWQDKVQRRDPSRLGNRFRDNRVARMFRCRRSRGVLDRDPVLWLMGERPLLKTILWSISGCWCLGVVLVSVALGPQRSAWGVFGFSMLILLILGILLVDHSCRFWVESRQNGNLEALLAVPLQNKEILSSHWASIRQHFLGPLLVVICAATLPSWISLAHTLLGRGPDGNGLTEEIVPMATVGGGMLLWFLATFVAIGYTGMWLSLKLRRPHFASGLTLLCVVLLPIMFCYLGFGLTLLFIFLPMSLLHSNLRGMILQRYIPMPAAKSKGPTPA